MTTDPHPDDIAAVRAEGRRLLTRVQENPTGAFDSRKGLERLLWNHAPALLADPAPEGPIAPLVMLQQVREAMEEGGFTPTTGNGYIGTLIDIRKLAEAAADPAPEGLSEEERLVVEEAREAFPPGDDPVSWPIYLSQRLLTIIDRLTAPTEEGTDA